MKSTDELIKLFRKNNLKITPQRRAIFDLLSTNKNHPTAEQIYQQISSIMPEVSRATIYNTLRELIALGELTSVEDLSESGTRYDTNIEPHHHLFCIRCHALIDLDVEFKDLNISTSKQFGYKIIKSQVTFYGICISRLPDSLLKNTLSC